MLEVSRTLPMDTRKDQRGNSGRACLAVHHCVVTIGGGLGDLEAANREAISRKRRYGNPGEPAQAQIEAIAQPFYGFSKAQQNASVYTVPEFN